MRIEYREEPCKSALNPVKGMGFKWSLNPYMGCVHRCTFCYVRHFEHRSDRPFDDRYGTSIRVKTNVAAVLRKELARGSWEQELVGMAPILPGISDRPEQLREVVLAAREAGATGIWANLLFLRPGTREHFLEHLAEDWPEQLPLYERLYEGKAYLGAGETKPLRAEVSALAREFGIRDRRKLKLAPPPEPEQLSLTL